MDRGRPLAVHRAETVGARVAAADDDDPLALRGDEPLVRNVIALTPPILERQVLHRVMDPGELTPGNRQIAGPAGATGEDHRVEVAMQGPDRHVDADVSARPEPHAGLLHQREAAVDEALLHLELGNAVAQQPADPIVTLEHGHQVPGAVELLGGGEAGRARAHHGDCLAGAGRRSLDADPALVERALDDRDLDALDRNRIVVDPEHARALTRRRAEAPRPLREVVRRVQAIDRLAPLVLVHEVIPVGDDVAERAALVTERNAAIHAPRSLLRQLVDRIGQVVLLPVAHALGDRARRRLLALDLEEAGDLTHRWSRRARRRSAGGLRPWRAPRRAARACSRAASP